MTPGAAADRRLSRLPQGSDPVRVIFVGQTAWLENCCPPGDTARLRTARLELGSSGLIEAAERFRPHVTVVFDPTSCEAELLASLPGVRLGVVVTACPEGAPTDKFLGLERLVSFRPALTATSWGAESSFWRAIPPPVSDLFFAHVRPLQQRPSSMTVGRATPYRESMLGLAKHHHDLLQVVHGIEGRRLAELLSEYDVGIYIPPSASGGFGQQVGLHLAAGQLLLSQRLVPEHGLETGIDYLEVDSAVGVAGTLERLARFPEMYQRVRIRGRLKAEQYRASRLFERVVHDLMIDVATFGLADCQPR